MALVDEEILLQAERSASHYAPTDRYGYRIRSCAERTRREVIEVINVLAAVNAEVWAAVGWLQIRGFSDCPNDGAGTALSHRQQPTLRR